MGPQVLFASYWYPSGIPKTNSSSCTTCSSDHRTPGNGINMLSSPLKPQHSFDLIRPYTGEVRYQTSNPTDVECLRNSPAMDTQEKGNTEKKMAGPQKTSVPYHHAAKSEDDSEDDGDEDESEDDDDDDESESVASKNEPLEQARTVHFNRDSNQTTEV